MYKLKINGREIQAFTLFDFENFNSNKFLLANCLIIEDNYLQIIDDTYCKKIKIQNIKKMEIDSELIIKDGVQL